MEENVENAEAGANARGVNSNTLIQPYGILTVEVLNAVQFLKIRKVSHTDRYDPLHLPAEVVFSVEEFTGENKLLVLAGILPQDFVYDIL